MATRPRPGPANRGPEHGVRREAIRRQRRLLEGLKQRIRDILGPDHPTLAAYRERYERTLARGGELATKAELIEACRGADVVFCGDYHTLLQSQKTTPKILRELVDERRVVLALECVRARDQRHLDAFMGGELAEDAFLRKIDYAGTWGFPWAHYRLFFDFARAHGLRVIGVNHIPPRGDPDRLLKRDAFAAQVLARCLREDPGALVWVVFGDLHVAPAHLPRELARILRGEGREYRQVLVFQNNKRLYFRLAEQGRLLDVDTVRLGPGRYCILNTPPWIKLRSFLDHLEATVFPPEEDEDEEDIEPPGYEDYILQLVQDLADFLEIQRDDLDDFQLYTADNLRSLETELHVPGPPGTLERLLESAKAHYLARDRVIYLSAFDSNHAAEAAAELLHHRCSGYRLEGRDPRDLFYLNALAKTLGFFGSQVLNPKRKTNYFKDHDLFLSRWRGRRLQGARALQRRVSRLVVQHQRAMEKVMRARQGRPRLRKVYAEDPALGFGVSRALGSIMGDKLFRAMMEGLVGKGEIQALFHRDLARPGAAYETYRELRIRLKAVKKPFKSKDDFF